MKWLEIKVSILPGSPPFAGEIIADLFFGFGLQGVVVENSQIEVGPGEIRDEKDLPADGESVTGYFPETDEGRAHIGKIEAALLEWETDKGIRCRVEKRKIDEEDWAHSWKEHFHPVKIGKRIVIRPAWREYSPADREIVIDLDPGMAFGTGTHPTTALCIELIESFLVPGISFLDLGTGSGILMIAAGKLGAKTLLGVDSDEVAVEIARKNLLQNRMGEVKFRIQRGDLADGIEGSFDMVAANLLTEPVLRLLDDAKKIVAPGGLLICSGILAENREKVCEKMVSAGFLLEEVRERESWIAVLGRNR